MAIETSKKLASGQAAASITTIYTAPTSTKGYIRSIIFFNSSPNPQIVEAFFNGAAAANQIFRKSLVFGETYEWRPDYNLILEAGETFRLKSSDASVLNYFLFGMEEA